MASGGTETDRNDLTLLAEGVTNVKVERVALL